MTLREIWNNAPREMRPVKCGVEGMPHDYIFFMMGDAPNGFYGYDSYGNACAFVGKTNDNWFLKDE